MTISMAAAMALAMTCLPSAAHADFVYVPPEHPVRDATLESGTDIGSTSAGRTGVRTVEDGGGNQANLSLIHI